MKSAKRLEESVNKSEWQPPIHAGEIIRRRFFAPLGVTQAEFCAEHGIERSKFSRILRGNQRITPETANELAAAFGMSAMFFLNLQSQHDLAVAGKERK